MSLCSEDEASITTFWPRLAYCLHCRFQGSPLQIHELQDKEWYEARASKNYPAMQVPQGTTPRSIVVHLRGALTRTCKPGDAVSISGVFLPEPYTGYRAMKAGLLTSTYLDAMGVVQLKQSYQEHAMDEALQARMFVSCLSGPLKCMPKAL